MTATEKCASMMFTMILIICSENVSSAAVVVFTYSPHATLYEGFPSQPIDFNADGTPEIVLSADSTQSGGWVSGHVQFQGIASPPPNLGSRATPVALGGVIGELPSSAGTWIDPASGIFTFRTALAEGTTGFWPTGLTPPPLNPDGTPGLGPLVPESGYLGVLFDLADGRHYGWVEVGVYPNSPLSFLRSFGWETSPSTPIYAGSVPEPGRAVLFLIGMTTLLHRRRRAESGATILVAKIGGGQAGCLPHLRRRRRALGSG